MILLVTPDRYGEFTDVLAAMHDLRYRIFKQRLGWEVETAGRMEVDSFDALRPHYLLLRGANDRLVGCVRFLPSQGPTMLHDVFPILLDGMDAPAAPDIWESSRFALDKHQDFEQRAFGLTRLTYELLAGMVEFGLSRKLSSIVTVTDVRMERILRRAQWPLERIGQPRSIGRTEAVAGQLEISKAALERLRAGGDIDGPVLWMPVMNEAA